MASASALETIADQKTMSYITQTISEGKQEVGEIIDEATHDRLKAKPGLTIRESFESDVERQLSLARDQSGQYAQKRLNNIKQMVVSDSKESFINTSQMSVCVGQQSVDGKRISFGFKHRMLPRFTKDFSPELRGFVKNSHLHGLALQEFFFHVMAGREDLISMAVKTAETGVYCAESTRQVCSNSRSFKPNVSIACFSIKAPPMPSSP